MKTKEELEKIITKDLGFIQHFLKGYIYDINLGEYYKILGVIPVKGKWFAYYLDGEPNNCLLQEDFYEDKGFSSCDDDIPAGYFYVNVEDLVPIIGGVFVIREECEM